MKTTAFLMVAFCLVLQGCAKTRGVAGAGRVALGQGARPPSYPSAAAPNILDGPIPTGFPTSVDDALGSLFGPPSSLGGAQPAGVYRVGGGGVTAPSLLYKVEPKYSEKALKAECQGTVLLYVQVDPSGKAVNMRVLHSLGLGLDEQTLEAVKKWIFRPGMKDGKPVVVEAQVETNFRLLPAEANRLKVQY